MKLTNEEINQIKNAYSRNYAASFISTNILNEELEKKYLPENFDKNYQQTSNFLTIANNDAESILNFVKKDFIMWNLAYCVAYSQDFRSYDQANYSRYCKTSPLACLMENMGYSLSRKIYENYLSQPGSVKLEYVESSLRAVNEKESDRKPRIVTKDEGISK